MKLTKYFIKQMMKGNQRDIGVVPNLEGDGGTFTANLVINIKPDGNSTHIQMDLVNNRGKKLMKYADIKLEADFCETLTVTGLNINHDFTLDSPF